MSLIGAEVAKLAQGLGKQLRNSFQAHIVETFSEEEQQTKESQSSNVADLPEDDEGSSFLDQEAREAAANLGKQSAKMFQERLAAMAHEAVIEDQQNGYVPFCV